MEIEIDFTKSARENADAYFEAAKKAKRKLAGLERGALVLEQKLKRRAGESEKRFEFVKKRERKWFEKFHWFRTSEGFLVVGGRDAQTNEFVVKRVMERNDIYFHADIHGAAHVVLKTGGARVGAASKSEAAVFAAVFSKAWASQLASVDVYSASPGQVSKSAPSGQSLAAGAFMVRGKREWFRNTPLGFAVGAKNLGERVELISGPLAAVERNTDFWLRVSFGSDSKSVAAKKIVYLLGKKIGGNIGLVDEVVALLPNGGIRVDE